MTSYTKVGDAVESGVAAFMRARELFGTELSGAQMAQCVFKPDGAHPTRQAVQQIRQRLQSSGASGSSSSGSAGKRRAPVKVSDTQGRDIGKVARRVKQRRGSVVAADVALRAKETWPLPWPQHYKSNGRHLGKHTCHARSQRPALGPYLGRSTISPTGNILAANAHNSSHCRSRSQWPALGPYLGRSTISPTGDTSANKPATHVPNGRRWAPTLAAAL